MLRQQAGDLLQRLIQDRESSDQRLAATGRRDPLKAVTGATALERAIASTREMIAEMDFLLAELDAGLHAATSISPATAPSIEQRSGSLLPRASGAAAAVRSKVGGMLSGQRPVAATA